MKSRFLRPVVRSGLGLAVAVVCLLAFLKTRQIAPSVSRAELSTAARKVLPDAVDYLSFSPDGKKLFASGNDAFDVTTAKDLDAHSLSVLHTLSLPKSARNVALTADWTKYVVYSDVPSIDQLNSQQSNYRLRFYDLQNGKPLGTNSEVSFGQAGLASISPRGDVLALTVGATNRGWWELWKIVGGRNLKSTPFQGHFEDGSAAVNCIAFSHSGKEIVAAGDTDTFAIWNVAQRKKLWEHSPNHLPKYSTDETQIWQVLFSPDDKTIATSGSDNKVRLWSAKDGKPLRVFEGAGNLLFSPDGSMLITAAESGQVKLWNVQSGQLLRTFVVGTPLPEYIRAVAVTPDGKFLAVGNRDGAIARKRLSATQ